MAIILGMGDLGTSALVTADNTYPSLPPTNVVTSPRGEVWRFPGQDSGNGEKAARLYMDFGSPRTFQLVLLSVARPAPTMLDGARARITAANASATGSDVYDGAWEPWTFARGYHAFVLAQPITARYLGVRLAIPTAQAYAQVGRVYVGPTLSLPNIAESGNTFALMDTSFLKPLRTQKLSLSMLSETQADALESLMMTTGTQRQVAIIPDSRRPSASAVLGKFTSLELPTPLGFWEGDAPIYSAGLAYKEDR